MKVSIDQKFFQKVYQVRFIQNRNFMLSLVEHEKNFYNHGTRCYPTVFQLTFMYFSECESTLIVFFPLQVL